MTKANEYPAILLAAPSPFESKKRRGLSWVCEFDIFFDKTLNSQYTIFECNAMQHNNLEDVNGAEALGLGDEGSSLNGLKR